MASFSSTPTELGGFFRSIREEKQLSVMEAAREIGYPFQYLSEVERGRIWNPGAKPSLRKHHHASGNIWHSLCSYYAIAYEDIFQNSYLKFGKYHPRLLHPTEEQNVFNGRWVKDVFDELILLEAYKNCQKRIAPTKTYLNKFAIAKGYSSFQDCPVTVFDSPLESVRNFINDQSESLGQHDLRNYKNNISYFIREARKSGLLPKQTQELISDYSLRKRKKAGRRGFPTNHALRVSNYVLTREELRQAPQFAEQLKDYFDFSTDMLRAPRSIRKRKSSMRQHNRFLLLHAGFLVHHLGVMPEDLTLEQLVEPRNVERYIAWLIERNKTKLLRAYGGDEDSFSGVTRNVEKRVVDMYILARYYLKNQAVAEYLKELQHKLDYPQRIRNKEKLLVPLKELERVGLSLYPYNSLRLSEIGAETRIHSERVLSYITEHRKFPEYYHAPIVENGRGCKRKLFLGRRFAHRVCFSLIFRLLVRFPIRQRNLREMKLGKNLFKEGNKFVISFKGEQLKVHWRGSETNQVSFSIEPSDETGFYQLLDEWLTLWRPSLLEHHRMYIQTARGKAQVERAKTNSQDIYHSFHGYYPPDCGVENHDYVFVNMNGMPWSLEALTVSFKAYAYKYLGVPLTPHLVRDCWATEYLVRTREETGHADVIGAAEMLGDTIQTIYKHYAHILGEKAQAKPRKWLKDYLLGTQKD